MRRTGWVLAGWLVCQLVWPRPADAWWGWIDELSGPRDFHGIQAELRLKCLGASAKAKAGPAAKTNGLAAVSSARELTDVNVPRLSENAGPDVRSSLDMLRTKAATLDDAANAVAEDKLDARTLLSMAQEADALAQQVRQARGGDVTLASELAGAWDHAAAELTVEAKSQLRTESYPGGKASLCPPDADRTRRWSVNLNARLFWTQDHDIERDPVSDPATEEYANGEKMWLLMATPGVSVRPLYLKRADPEIGTPPTRLQWLDLLDVGGGVGAYSVSSAGFETLHGVAIEGHIDIHAPSALVRRQLKKSRLYALIFPQLRVSGLGFVDGFKANAFGPKLRGPKGEAIPGIDWARRVFAVMFDFGSVVR